MPLFGEHLHLGTATRTKVSQTLPSGLDHSLLIGRLGMLAFVVGVEQQNELIAISSKEDAVQDVARAFTRLKLVLFETKLVDASPKIFPEPGLADIRTKRLKLFFDHEPDPPLHVSRQIVEPLSDGFVTILSRVESNPVGGNPWSFHYPGRLLLSRNVLAIVEPPSSAGKVVAP